jgi:hypothetical protein
MIPFGGNNA